jgi:hypothetical protein
MKVPHLLAVSEGPAAFAPLVQAAAVLGLKVGWLELPSELPPCPPPFEDLEAAAVAGVLRAVAVGRDRTVVVKARRGEAVMTDLLREHFLGCALVLVRASEAPSGMALLEVVGDGFRVHATGPFGSSPGVARVAAEELAARLRRPQPW